MRALKVFAAILVGLPVAIVGLYKLSYPSAHYRYRMTVSVEVDGQIHSGSSVIEVQIHDQPNFGNNNNVVTVSGEAVFVDLGDERNIVALLLPADSERNPNLPARIVPSHFGLQHGTKRLHEFSKLKGSWNLPNDLRPAIISFKNIRDPESAQLVERATIESVLGPKISLPKISISMTSDPVTYNLDQKLPWLAGADRRQLTLRALRATGYRPIHDSEKAFYRR